MLFRSVAEKAPDPPRVYTDIQFLYRVAGKVSRKAVEDAVRLSEQKYCSVSAMLKKTATITYRIELDSQFGCRLLGPPLRRKLRSKTHPGLAATDSPAADYTFDPMATVEDSDSIQ